MSVPEDPYGRDIAAASTDELLSAAGRGDLAGLAAFYDRTAPVVHGFLHGALRGRAAAERATENVYLQLWRAAPQFRPSDGSAISLLLRGTRAELIGREHEPAAQGPPHAVGDVIVALADALAAGSDLLGLLDRLAGYSVQLLAADTAAVLLADDHRDLRFVASTNEQTEWLERTLRLLRADEGPCARCLHTGNGITVADTAAPWPGALAAAGGGDTFRSVHALPLRLRGRTLGTLALFGRRPGVLPAADLAIGQALADLAAIGILQEEAAHRGEQLQIALEDRAVVEQAKGVLAEHGGLAMDAAFTRLRRYARHRDRGLSDVARDVVGADLATEVLAPSDQEPAE